MTGLAVPEGVGGFLGSGAGAGGMTGSALMPGWLKTRRSGSSRSVPVKPTSTVVPTFAPVGEIVFIRGTGRLLTFCCWAQAGAARARRASAAGAVHGRERVRVMGPSVASGSYPAGAGRGAGGDGAWAVGMAG